MSISQAQLFEDDFPLVRCCPTLNEIRIAEEMKDLTIEAQNGALLHVHRIIVAARIPSLRATLRGPLGLESMVLRWPSVPLSIAALLIDYVYTGQVEMTQANAKGLVMLARILDLPLLEHWGAEFMASSVNSENLAVTWDFARSLNIRVLSEACIHHMKMHFESFVCSDLFVRLPANTVLALLRSEDLAIESEEEVFEAISRWVSPCVDGDREKLTIHAATMLRQVQWHRTTVQFRKRLMESHPIFQNSLEFARFLVLVEQWIGAAGGNKPTCPFNILSRRMSPPQSFLIYGMEKNENKWSVFRFDSSLRKAERIGYVGLRYGASFSVVGESLFVVGGWNENQYASKDVNEFLVRGQSWRQRPSLIVPRFDHAAAVVSVHTGDKEGEETTLIGIFGGSVRRGDTYRRLRCCEVYDVNRNRWHKLPNLREKRCGAAAAVLPDDNRVFLFGGRGDAGVSASVEFCQLRTFWPEAATFENFWLPAAPMRTARAFLAAAHFRGRILVAGGWDYREDVNVVEMFSPPDAVCPLGQWTELAPMKQPRAFSAILTSADSVFVLGGGMKPRNTVESFTASDDSADFDNDLTSWIWSSEDSVGEFEEIIGAAAMCI